MILRVDPAAVSTPGRLWTLRLFPHQDVKAELDQFAREHALRAGYVASAVGSLEQVALRYANQPQYTVLTGHFEVVSLSGTLADSSSHLHLAVSDSTGRTIGGHLGVGSLVYTTMEIVVGEAKGVAYERVVDPTYGYRELDVRPLAADGSELRKVLRVSRDRADALPARAQRVLDLRDATDHGDPARVALLLAPDSRAWFEARTGPGTPRDANGKDDWADWDRYFHAVKSMRFIRAGGDSAVFRLTETNDWYRLIDRAPSETELTYWFDDADRITGTLVRGLPQDPEQHGALGAFKKWESARDPKALAWLLPDGSLVPDLAHARRWKQALTEWRRAAGLPAVK